MSAALQPALAALARAETLAPDALEAAFDAILVGEASPAQIGALLMGLEQTGLTAATIAAGARALRAAMTPTPFDGQTIDVCGTGGDGAHTLNISTAVAFVLAGCGLTVAKHGNRAMSSKSGAADVLEALGVRLDIPPEAEARALREAGVAFLFAQAHHPAMRHVAGPRRELGFRTVFNLLGPLSNPAGAKRQLVGVFAPDKLDPMAEALAALGAEAGWVVHGDGGLDEIALSGPSAVCALAGGVRRSFTIAPQDAGLEPAPLSAVAGGDAAFNAAALRALLAGAPGAYRDMVVLNAAAGLIVAGRASSLREGAALAAASIAEGRAGAALDRLIAVTTGAA